MMEAVFTESGTLAIRQAQREAHQAGRACCQGGNRCRAGGTLRRMVHVRRLSALRRWPVEVGSSVLVLDGSLPSPKDMTWCLKAIQSKWGTEQEDGGVIGLSYGIEQRDLWSEKMSNLYRVPTRLYDCFQRPDDSPALGGKAPNATGKCAEDGNHCYETPYQVFQICSGPETGTIHGRRYESLESHLQDRKRLSVHLKIDTEGSEWEVLAWLLSSPQDMNKIRTLDMEVHLGWVADSAQSSARASMSSTARVDYDIKLLEDLGKFFRCTGSSMEVLAEGWGNDGRGAYWAELFA